MTRLALVLATLVLAACSSGNGGRATESVDDRVDRVERCRSVQLLRS